jgi:hypothetical protein
MKKILAVLLLLLALVGCKPDPKPVTDLTYPERTDQTYPNDTDTSITK